MFLSLDSVIVILTKIVAKMGRVMTDIDQLVVKRMEVDFM